MPKFEAAKATRWPTRLAFALFGTSASTSFITRRRGSLTRVDKTAMRVAVYTSIQGSKVRLPGPRVHDSDSMSLALTLRPSRGPLVRPGPHDLQGKIFGLIIGVRGKNREKARTEDSSGQLTVRASKNTKTKITNTKVRIGGKGDAVQGRMGEGQGSVRAHVEIRAALSFKVGESDEIQVTELDALEKSMHTEDLISRDRVGNGMRYVDPAGTIAQWKS
ncbi:hypothetical protein B0H16DRAFT_1478393 [Mycena metata]|uniref:Uncharacterized protein n=1 Tax=Mycena metata TaxID=1033252 RepID=A0AAD7H831_9AGAR|nr:hypothetical protein B0H16DRAFT_1478393 [Mycena metata]